MGVKGKVKKFDTSKLKKKNLKMEKQGSNRAIEWKKKGQELFAILVKQHIIPVGDEKRNQYEFVDVANEHHFVWESTVLKCLQNAKPGDIIRIVYLGEKGKGRKKYRNFDVYFEG